MFGTGLNYVVLRLLGVDAEHPIMIKARATLHKLGTIEFSLSNVERAHQEYSLLQVAVLEFRRGESSGFRS